MGNKTMSVKEFCVWYEITYVQIFRLLNIVTCQRKNRTEMLLPFKAI